MSDYSLEISAASEDRHREFKRSAPWESLKYKIAMSAMAMANKRDGGLIIIGVAEHGDELVASGMAEEHLTTYEDDEIVAFINRYADPYVVCSVHRQEVDGRKFIVIAVSEFDHLPIVCKKSGEGNLRQGTVYIRSYQKPETCAVQSQTEMRELLDVATDRGIRNFLSRAESAGIQTQLGSTDAERFSIERREFMGRLSESKRLSSGCFIFSFHPVQYDENLIEPIVDLHRLVREHSIRRIGWMFPFTVRDEEATEQRCVGSPAHPKDWDEFWRMYQSGHFLYAIAYREDTYGDPHSFMDHASQVMAPHGFNPSGTMNIHVFHLLATLAYEFASRLAISGSYATPLRISVLLTNTRDRVAINTSRRAPIRRFWRATAAHVESVRVLELEQLAANPRGEAAVAITDVMARFGGEEVSLKGTKAVQDYVFRDESCFGW